MMLRSTLVTIIGRPMGRHPWLTIVRRVSGPSTTMATAPSSKTAPSRTSRFNPGAGPPVAVHLLEELVGREGERVAQQEDRRRLAGGRGVGPFGEPSPVEGQAPRLKFDSGEPDRPEAQRGGALDLTVLAHDRFTG